MKRITRTLVGGAFAIASSVLAFLPTAALADPNAPYAPTTTTTPVPANPPPVPTNSDATGSTASEEVAPAGSASAAADDAQRYAELEAASGDTAEFRGGSAGVYIGVSSGAAIVILVILLVILL